MRVEHIIYGVIVFSLIITGGCSAEKRACIESSGEWVRFDNDCGDKCEYHYGEITECNQIPVQGCDCGEKKCLRGNECRAFPYPPNCDEVPSKPIPSKEDAYVSIVYKLNTSLERIEEILSDQNLSSNTFEKLESMLSRVNQTVIEYFEKETPYTMVHIHDNQFDHYYCKLMQYQEVENVQKTPAVLPH